MTLFANEVSMENIVIKLGSRKFVCPCEQPFDSIVIHVKGSCLIPYCHITGVTNDCISRRRMQA